MAQKNNAALIQELKDDNERLRRELYATEARLDELRRMVTMGRPEQQSGGDAPDGRSKVMEKVFQMMSVKQHVVMQCVLTGMSNREIEERMGVGENTAKTYVRGMLHKFGLNKRDGLSAEVTAALEAMPNEEYESASGGLPKDWAETYTTRDKHKKKYFGVTK